jgi:hypothetical protein
MYNVHHDETPCLLHPSVSHLVYMARSESANVLSSVLFLPVSFVCLLTFTRVCQRPPNHHIHNAIPHCISNSPNPPPPTPPRLFLSCRTHSTRLRHLPYPFGNHPHRHPLAQCLCHRRPSRPLQHGNRERAILERRIHLPWLSYPVHQQSVTVVGCYKSIREKLDGVHRYYLRDCKHLVELR